MPNVIVNGVSIFYRIYPKEEIIPTSLAVVLIPGSGCSSRRWFRQFPPDSGESPIRGVTLLAIELPGHANSEGEGLETVEDFAGFIKDFVKALGLTRIILVGNSLGGAIALQLALEMPSWLKGVVLVGTGAKLRVFPEILTNLAKDVLPAELAELSYASTTSLSQKAELESDNTLTSNSVRLRDLLACDQFDIRHRLSEISLPALIIVGAEDRLTPVQYSKYLHNNLKNSRLCIIPDAGHMVMYEQSALFNTNLTKFLANFF